jgi:hypothetical protein
MIALGNNAHIFARPARRDALKWLFETVLQYGPVATVDHPGMAMPMLVVRLPDGGSLSMEFIEEAADADQPRFATWLELRTADPAALMRTVLEAGLTEVKHPGHPYYFMAPGGQVFTIVPSVK